MRIYHLESDSVLSEVSIFLTKLEAKQFISYLQDLIENPTGNSASLNNESHTKEITLVVYDSNDTDLKGFNERVKKIILEDK